MNIENGEATLAWLSRCTVRAAGIAGLCMAAACSPVSGESEETTDGHAVEDPVKTPSPIVRNGSSWIDDCALTGTCPDPMCKEPGRYLVEGDIVIDLENERRMWQRDYASDLDFAQAAAYCEGLELGGLTGWRLPDGAESGSIVLHAGGLKGCGAPEYCTPAIDQFAFPGTEVDLYWISLSYDDGTHLARSFCDGRSTPYQEEDSALHYVRCVRDALEIP